MRGAAYTCEVTSRPLSLRLLNDSEVVVAGLRAMLAPFADRIRIAEVDVQSTADRWVDVTLYDTFGSAQANRGDIDEVLADPAAGSVVVYTWNMQQELVDAALGKGCRGYLDKTLAAARLVDCLESIGAGEVVTSDAREPRPDDVEPLGAWPGQREGLTMREAEVIALITQGLSNSEITARSYISINSLKSYIRSAYRKMGVDRRAQAVRWGMEHGLSLSNDKP